MAESLFFLDLAGFLEFVASRFSAFDLNVLEANSGFNRLPVIDLDTDLFRRLIASPAMEFV